MPSAGFRETVSPSGRRKFAMEPGFGPFAHDAAKLADARVSFVLRDERPDETLNS